MDLVLRVPIIIGSIPTQNSFNQFQGNLNGFPPPVPSLPSYSNQEFVPPFEGGVDQLQPSAPSLPMMQQYPDLREFILKNGPCSLCYMNDQIVTFSSTELYGSCQ